MLTSAGYKRKRYIDYFEVMSEQARELYGEDVDLSERSPVGKFVSLIAYARAEENEEAEAVYNSRFVDTSEGVPLDQNVKRVITRKPWKKAKDDVALTLERGAKVPVGTLVGTLYGVLYETLESVSAIEDGEYIVPVQAIEFGRVGNAPAGDIKKIVTPVVGLLAVTNPGDFVNGQDRESDPALIDRYYDSLGNSGNRRSESIRARVLDEVEGVRSVQVIDNDTMEMDAAGRPPKSFETIVLGGAAPEIARKILESKSAGIQAYGSTIEQVEDSKGKLQTIGFSYAETLPVYVNASVKKGSDYPLNGDDQVKEQIVKFVGGTSGMTVYNGLGMNEDVVLARLEAQLFRVEGVEDVKVSLSTDGLVYLEENIEIGFAQVAETDISKIEVSRLVN